MLVCMGMVREVTCCPCWEPLETCWHVSRVLQGLGRAEVLLTAEDWLEIGNRLNDCK